MLIEHGDQRISGEGIKQCAQAEGQDGIVINFYTSDVQWMSSLSYDLRVIGKNINYLSVGSTAK